MNDDRFAQDFADSKRYRSHVQELMRMLLRDPSACLELVSDETDREKGVDYRIAARGERREIRLGLRVRTDPDAVRKWGDEFTVRFSRPSGVATEWAKFGLDDGPTECLYGFAAGRQVAGWCLYLPRLLRRAVDEKRLAMPEPRRNPGHNGSSFLAFKRERVWRVGRVMVAEQAGDGSVRLMDGMSVDPTR